MTDENTFFVAPSAVEGSQVAQPLNIRLADIAFSLLPTSRMSTNIIAISSLTGKAGSVETTVVSHYANIVYNFKLQTLNSIS